MLTEFRFTNIKLFEELKLSLGRITVCIGANGAGKSTVLQVLAAASQSVGSNQLSFDGPKIQLGTPTDVLHNPGDPSVALDFHLEGESDWRVSTLWKDSQLTSQEAVVTVSSPADQFVLSTQHDVQRGESSQPERVPFGPYDFQVDVRPQFGHPFNLLPIKQAREDPIWQEAARRAGALERSFEGFLQGCSFVPAMRGATKSSYVIWSQTPGVHYLYEPAGPEQAARTVASMLEYEREALGGRLSEWLSRLVQFKVSARTLPHEGQVHVYVQAAREGRKVNIRHEGFGGNQLVPLLVPLALNGSMVCIEEPEIHLHPRAQLELVRILVEVAREDGKQLLLTTHSEHIIMGLLTAVAEGAISPEDLAILHFFREGDVARAEQLPVSRTGQISGGLKGFFEVDIEELDRYIAAQARR